SFETTAELHPAVTSPGDFAAWERQRLSDVLTQTGWNISRTAAILGITRNTVRARITKYDLQSSGSVRRTDESPSADAPDTTTAEPDEAPGSASAESELGSFPTPAELGSSLRHPVRAGEPPSLSSPSTGPSRPGAGVIAPGHVEPVRGR